MADFKEILYEKQRGGALITLNRPEAMNAISRSMIKELHQALDEARATQGTKAYLQLRDGPFQPEPFGPRSKRKAES